MKLDVGKMFTSLVNQIVTPPLRMATTIPFVMAPTPKWI